MNRFCKTLCKLLACLMLFATLNVARPAQGEETGESLFPNNPDAWLNSPPISSEMLKNKAAILYFYEEG